MKIMMVDNINDNVPCSKESFNKGFRLLIPKFIRKGKIISNSIKKNIKLGVCIKKPLNSYSHPNPLKIDSKKSFINGLM